MFSNITTKLAMKKMGIPSDAFNFSGSKDTASTTAQSANADETSGASWSSWMSMKNLPLTVQPWLTPTPPPVTVAECPKVGDLAPIDRDRRLAFGGGKKVLVVFLRCVGCAFAQKTFLALRTIANRYAGVLTCIAVSHSSEQATYKWMDMMGGAWNVQVIIDEERSIYAAWGLGLGSVWYVLNPTSQIQGFKVNGWLGQKVATAVKRGEALDKRAQQIEANGAAKAKKGSAVSEMPEAEEAVGPTTAMGNKWQQAGSWAVDQRGTIVWGGKALRADDVMDLDAAVRALGF